MRRTSLLLITIFIAACSPRPEPPAPMPGLDLYDKSGALTVGGNALKNVLGTAVT